ncbi:MAG: SPOR domain-containing protein [Smithella sp.]|jgi:cell division septation protein DedD
MASGNIKNFELKMGKTGVVIIIAGMAALLCAAFLFGVDVGKNIDIYPEKIAAFPQRALALVWRPARINVAQSATDNKAGENIDLTFYDALTTKKGIANAETVQEKQPSVSQPKKEEETVKGNFNIEAQKTPQTADDKNDAIQENKIIETALDNASGKHKFIVQVASLKEKTKANQISKKISSSGFKPEIIKTEVKGKGIMFRVIASGFENKVKAQDAAKSISAQTGTNCIVKSVDNSAKDH